MFNTLCISSNAVGRTQFICYRCIRTLRTSRPSITKPDRSDRKKLRISKSSGPEWRTRPPLRDARQPEGFRLKEEGRSGPRVHEASNDRDITRPDAHPKSAIRRLHGTDRNALARMEGASLRERQRSTSRSGQIPDIRRTNIRPSRRATEPKDDTAFFKEDFPFMPADADSASRPITISSNTTPSTRETPIQFSPDTVTSYQPTFLLNSIPPELLASYNDTTPPNSIQLAYGTRFFTTSPISFLHSSVKFRTLPVSSVPEVAFLGRSNVGKSSLLNALVHRTGMRIANVSSKPGRTRSMNAFGVGGDDGGVRMVGGRKSGDQGNEGGDEEGYGEHAKWIGKGGLVVLDMPGYGKSSKEEWGKEIIKYLSDRKQLRKAFILIDSVHGIKASDLSLLTLLSRNGIAHQIVLSKIDKIIHPRPQTSYQTVLRHTKTMHGLCRRVLDRVQSKQGRGLKVSGDVLTCSAEKAWPVGSGRKMGIQNLRWAVLKAVGLECDVQGNKRILDVDVQEKQEDDISVAKTGFRPQPPRPDRDAVVDVFHSNRYATRRDSTYTPRREPKYTPLGESDYKRRPELNYTPRRESNYDPRPESNYPPRRESNNPSRRESNYPSRRESNYPPRRESNNPLSRESTYPPRRESKYPPRPETPYTPRPLHPDRGAAAQGSTAARRPSARREPESTGDARAGQQRDRPRKDWIAKAFGGRKGARGDSSSNPHARPWMARGTKASTAKASKGKASKGGRRAVKK